MPAVHLKLDNDALSHHEVAEIATTDAKMFDAARRQNADHVARLRQCRYDVKGSRDPALGPTVKRVRFDQIGKVNRET